ncbi:MAG: tRNA (adenosine(37)-N6)-dimethylallyltransferase MiaA [Frankiales bacterium]|nr:tRNA (adenosine(37)-N6)-dimethylallyltransferase MiaA [Frankiales bacterium]
MAGRATGDAASAAASRSRGLTDRVVAVVGPTAAGKSALAVRLAAALLAGGQRAEIINADSMQLYRGMDIGTAKLRPDERGGVPHHLLDIWPVTQPASVADYQRLARDRISELHARGVLPLLVGGSGLYVRAALDRLDFPGTDPALRAALENELERVGPEPLHQRLAVADPAAAAAILPSNGRRIVRALEVVAITGRPFTAGLPSYDAVYDAVQIGIDDDPAALDQRIDERVAHMFAAGLVDEVRTLEAAGLRTGRTASRALGYQQVLAMLDGMLTEAEAQAETARATRRFVRRQRSWFRRDPRVQWLAQGADLLDRAVQVALS